MNQVFGDIASQPSWTAPRRHDPKWDARKSHKVPHDNYYYAKCVSGGVLSSSIRWVMTPLDCVKCNMQVNPSKYTSLTVGLRMLWTEGGVAGLYRGLAPTVMAYGIQSGTKFGLYEVFKDQFSTAAGKDRAHEYRGLIYVAASGCAEICADVLMCPWETMKVRLQTASPGAFPTSLGPAFAAMVRQRAEYSFPFGSLGPLIARQLPGTVVTFYTFENTVEAIYSHILTNPKESYSEATQLACTFFAGYVGGVCSAIVSHPADSLVSLKGMAKHKGKSLSEIASEVGFTSLATKGLGPRMFMLGTIMGFQWWTYDTFKTYLGLGTSGGTPQEQRLSRFLTQSI